MSTATQNSSPWTAKGQKLSVVASIEPADADRGRKSYDYRPEFHRSPAPSPSPHCNDKQRETRQKLKG